MSMQDPIADMLTRIRNALMVNKEFVVMPASKIKKSIAAVLTDEGYIGAVENLKEFADKNYPHIKIALKYFKGNPVIEAIKQVSRPGLRVYKPADDLPSVQNGLGEAIVSTSKGVMTAKKAKKMGLGGEVMVYVN